MSDSHALAMPRSIGIIRTHGLTNQKEDRMMQLLERQIGTDPEHIGFPSVQTCMAVVVLTTTEMIGWHSLNTHSNVLESDAGKLATFIGAMARGTPLHLYVATNRKANAGNWRDQLRDIARGLGYQGPATSIDLAVNVEGVYVQFDRDSGARACSISYKRNSKMDYDTGKSKMNVGAVRHKQLGAGGADYGDIYSSSGRTTVHTNIGTNANSAKGKLNKVGWSQSDTITIS